MKRNRLQCSTSRATLRFALISSALAFVSAACCYSPEQPDQDTPQTLVVVYTALDRGFAEPILEKFEATTGIKVAAQYDTESTKTIGLVNRIRAEKNRPRCDVFWNNEIVNTIRLKNEGLLQPCSPVEATNYPPQYRDPDGYWYGFAARARVLIVNTDLVPTEERPVSIFDLTDPRYRGRIGIAKPLFGTTASHMACLFATLGEPKAQEFLKRLKHNHVRILAGNKTCAVEVAAGRLAFALTDTDDAIIELESGKPVEIIYPDGDSDGIGTLFIPNTLALVKGGPHPEAGERLINFLLSASVEEMLAKGPSAQIPLRRNSQTLARVKTPQQVKTLDVDFHKAALAFEKAARYIQLHFLD
ncbi:MAG: extracellular solute-binding protein [Planctomycetes bacterium]|nr:extracellular solute-binding protein [Planctomycetota bacterium]